MQNVVTVPKLVGEL